VAALYRSQTSENGTRGNEMSAVHLTIIYIVFGLFLIAMDYYINLFASKDQFTKDELKSIMPHLKSMIKIIENKYSFGPFLLFYIVATCLGIGSPLLSAHWFTNSSILLVVIFFTFAFLKDYFEKSMVTASDNYLDIFANIFSKHSEVLTLGFSIGTGCSLIYVWGNNREIGFIWFLINMVIITIITEFTMRNVLKEKVAAPPQNP
jgi:hypothetical protein